MDERRSRGEGKKRGGEGEWGGGGRAGKKEGKKDVGLDVESAYSSQTKTRSGPMNLT